ncbi:MAG TPA: hypothetical protein VFR85_16915, partial [Anaeromyxobacteraceae bacterium]|nr:hypothetical protein [Anaeromyxobacteraceae bacterium]
MARISIRLKLIGIVLAVTVLVGGSAMLAIRYTAGRNSRIAGELAVGTAARALEHLEQADVEKLSAALEGLVAHPGLAKAFQDR